MSIVWAVKCMLLDRKLQPVAKVLQTPYHIKVASNTRPCSKLGGTSLNGRDEGGQYYISQTCDQERLEARKVGFSWECLNIFATGCSERYFWRGHHKTLTPELAWKCWEKTHKSRVKSPVVSRGEGSEEEVGDSSLVQYKTRFVQISHILFFYEAHSCCSSFLISCPDATLSYTVGDLGTILPPSLLLTHSQLFINTFWELHYSSRKPLVLSNVVQWGSLSSSIEDYNSSRHESFMNKFMFMWSSEL